MNPREVGIDFVDGAPKAWAFKVVGDTVKGARKKGGATETTRWVARNTEAGVGDPGIAPGFQDGKTD